MLHISKRILLLIPTRGWWAQRCMTKPSLTSALAAVYNFQTNYSVRIHVGELVLLRWADGAATWLRDCMEIFEGYGWSWTYHAYKESDYFDLQYANQPVGTTGAQRSPVFTDRYNQVVGWGLNLNQ